MSDDYESDTWLLKITHGWYDPCPLYGSGGLLNTWNSKTYVNPPYSNPLPWVKKAIHENKVNGFTIMMLLKHDSSTEWYRLLHEAGAHFLTITGRLAFQTGTKAPFPSLLAVLEGDWE